MADDPRTKKIKRLEMAWLHYGLREEDFTCADCPSADECEWAWDPYNTQGDCLMEK